MLFAQPAIFPLKDVRPGMHGTGKTVFSGSRVEEFQVEILGVLENVGPKQSIILARLSGGPLDKTGVIQGMSGSPVYLNGKLAGAVAMAFSFAKEPIAGIRPIEEMLRVGNTRSTPHNTQPLALLSGTDLKAAALPREEFVAGQTRLIDIATPVFFGGFTRATIDYFAPRLRALGLEPMQGASGGGGSSERMGNPARLQPGSMISVELISGDLNVGADGTVTCIDGKNLYAFGHRFLAAGSTELPFARADVLALLPNLSSSFKISAAREWMGTITQDRSTAIAGILGRRAALVPVSISMNGREPEAYRLQMVNDSMLSPLLLQMAIFSAVDANERSIGASSFRVRGQVEFEGHLTPVRLDNMYTGDANTALQVSLGVAIPVSYALQSGFNSLRLKNVSLSIDAYERKDQYQIDQVWTSAREVRPGDHVDLTVVLEGENGREVSKKVTYNVPVGSPLGPLYFTVADGNTTNLAEFASLVGVPARTPSQVVGLLNDLRDNEKAYVRVWRADAGYQVDGLDFPDPPPSVALILGRAQAAGGNLLAWRGSKIAELAISAGDAVISGSKTVQVEVKQ
ncbi:MAG TPA: SpoIVB peptidase S55 domain-containing protein [Bryobacteraceae bacterium]|nr:SpoIVB peptidase S55 domain-containing protein [Bryobacteraceae bacterium]